MSSGRLQAGFLALGKFILSAISVLWQYPYLAKSGGLANRSWISAASQYLTPGLHLILFEWVAVHVDCGGESHPALYAIMIACAVDQHVCLHDDLGSLLSVMTVTD
jgi:hypothetical protein